MQAKGFFFPQNPATCSLQRISDRVVPWAACVQELWQSAPLEPAMS